MHLLWNISNFVKAKFACTRRSKIYAFSLLKKEVPDLLGYLALYGKLGREVTY